MATGQKNEENLGYQSCFYRGPKKGTEKDLELITIAKKYTTLHGLIKSKIHYA